MSIDVNPDWWKRIFDDIYLLTDARSVCDDNLTYREVDLILEMLPIQSQHRILDLCGGHGRHSLELSERGVSACTLADFSEALTERAKTEADLREYPVKIIRCDARCTGLSSESFDHVLIMGNSLGYIQLPDADSQILIEAHRVLKPGGWLLVDVTNGAAVKGNFVNRSWHEIEDDTVVCRYRELHEDRVDAREMVLSKKKGLVRDETYSIRLYDTQTFPELIRKTGFHNVEVKTDFPPHGKAGDYGFMNHRMVATAQKTL
jgi:D-alanine-D-alanine ligase